MAVVDSSVVIAAFDSSHPHHATARRALDRELVVGVCSTVIEESTRILRRMANDAGQDGNRIARESLASLRAMGGYRHLADDVEEAATKRYTDNPRLSFVDAWTIELAKATGQDLLTFDRDHLKAWKAAR